jgi:hypothetical protein
MMRLTRRQFAALNDVLVEIFSWVNLLFESRESGYLSMLCTYCTD